MIGLRGPGPLTHNGTGQRGSQWFSGAAAGANVSVVSILTFINSVCH